MNNKWITILLSIIAIAMIYIAVCQYVIIGYQQREQQWEYSSKDMLDVDTAKINFAEENDWLKERWEPIMPLYVKESTGMIRVLVRRPRSDQ